MGTSDAQKQHASTLQAEAQRLRSDPASIRQLGKVNVDFECFGAVERRKEYTASPDGMQVMKWRSPLSFMLCGMPMGRNERGGGLSMAVKVTKTEKDRAEEKLDSLSLLTAQDRAAMATHTQATLYPDRRLDPVQRALAVVHATVATRVSQFLNAIYRPYSRASAEVKLHPMEPTTYRYDDRWAVDARFLEIARWTRLYQGRNPPQQPAQRGNAEPPGQHPAQEEPVHAPVQLPANALVVGTPAFGPNSDFHMAAGLGL